MATKNVWDFKLALTNPDGEVLETFLIGGQEGFYLDRQVARHTLVQDITDAVNRAMQAKGPVSINGVGVGDSLYVGNQGSVRVAKVIRLNRSRATVQFKNSVREMIRDVAIELGPANWIKGNTSAKALPRFVCSPTEQALLDLEPRISVVRSALVRKG